MKDELLNFLSQNAIPLIAGVVFSVSYNYSITANKKYDRAKHKASMMVNGVMTQYKPIDDKEEKAFYNMSRLCCAGYLISVAATALNIYKGNNVLYSVGSFALSAIIVNVGDKMLTGKEK